MILDAMEHDGSYSYEASNVGDFTGNINRNNFTIRLVAPRGPIKMQEHQPYVTYTASPSLYGDDLVRETMTDKWTK